MEDKEINSSYELIGFRGTILPKQYHNMIKAKWKRSFRHGNDYIRLCDLKSYYLAYDTYIASILQRAHVMVLLAVLSDNHDIVLGFCIFERNHHQGILHYVYVQKDFRKIGIAKMIVPTQIDIITHLTRTGLELWNSKCPKAIFNPFA